MSGQRIYLAARYSRHVEMQGYADALRADRHIVEVAWIKGEHRMADASQDFDGSGALFAADDWRDLRAADIVISFTGSGGRGGRHVEFGMGLAWGKRSIIVGPRENVFHWLPQVEQFDTWPEALRALRVEDFWEALNEGSAEIDRQVGEREDRDAEWILARYRAPTPRRPDARGGGR